MGRFLSATEILQAITEGPAQGGLHRITAMATFRMSYLCIVISEEEARRRRGT